MKRLVLALSLLASVASAQGWSPAVGGTNSTPQRWTQHDTSIEINEVYADNDVSAIVDDDGDESGFVEIIGITAHDISGWTLHPTGSPYNSFVFPAETSIAAGGYVRVWASGKDDVTDTTNFHAPFYLHGASAVRLTDSFGTLRNTITLDGVYPDVSYGRCEDDCTGRTMDYFDTATDGTANSSVNRLEVVSRPKMSLGVGETKSIGAFTTDGSTPTYSLPTSDWLDPDPPTDGTVTVLLDHADQGDTPPTVEVVRSVVGGTTSDTDVTVVSWETASSELRIVGKVFKYEGDLIYSVLNQGGANADDAIIMGRSDDTRDGCVYFTVQNGTDIFCTKNGFQTATDVGQNPRATGLPSPFDVSGSRDQLFRTPLGDFFISVDVSSENRAMFWWSATGDLTTWAVQDVDGVGGGQTDLRGVESGYDWYYDEVAEELHIVYTEYSTTPSNTHSIYYAHYDSGTTTGDFIKAYTFPSIDTDEFESVTHTHVARFDPYTGDCWVGTGDSNTRSKVLVSYDYCETFTLLITGSEYERPLSFWFTEDSVWYNTDSSSFQRINRMDRSNTVAGVWPVISVQTSNSGTLTVGQEYAIASIASSGSGTIGNLTGCAPCAEPDIGTVPSSPATVLAAGDSVVVVSDSADDYRETWDLDNTSHWWTMPVSDGAGGWLTLMSTSNDEGAVPSQRDTNARVFAIQENSPTSIDVQEVLMGNYPSGVNGQLEPAGEDSAGNLYFRDRNLGYYIGRLDWSGEGVATSSPTTPPVTSSNDWDEGEWDTAEWSS